MTGRPVPITDRVDAVKHDLQQSFRLACRAHDLSDDEANLVLIAIVDDMAASLSHAVPPPTEAPERWADRNGRQENPARFIRRVYADYLPNQLSRADIRRIDPKLYNALAVWEHRHRAERMLDLKRGRPRSRSSFTP